MNRGPNIRDAETGPTPTARAAKALMEPVVILGCAHHPSCLVARHPDPDTWETPGFPWCTCPAGFRETGPGSEEGTQ